MQTKKKKEKRKKGEIIGAEHCMSHDMSERAEGVSKTCLKVIVGARSDVKIY